ncbi:conserved hypothetical protein [Methylocella tundrae]|nr:conserved hypothetical protein [Methylocella tundrae]
MAVFSVHLPGEDVARIGEAAFVREGFCARAFVFGPLWLLRRRLWLWAGLWFAAFLLLVLLGAAGALSFLAILTLLFLLQLLLGLEANRLIEGRLWSQGYNLAEIIAAPALDQAEMVFYRQFGANEPPPAQSSAHPSQIHASAPASPVLGSLPEPEARR